MGNVAILKRPLLALIVVALAAALIGMPARASAGAGGPLDQMDAVVDHMEDAVEAILADLEWQLANAETEADQAAAYVNATNAIQAKRQQKSAALADIAGKSPALRAAMVPFQIEINEIADEALEEAAELLEDADPPELPTTTTSIPLPTTTTITIPRSTTTTVHSSTTTTRPRSTTTTTTQPAATTTTKPAPPPTTQPPATPGATAPPVTSPPTTVPAAGSTTSSTTTNPGLLASAGSDDGTGGSSLSDLGVRSGDQSGVLESDLSALRSPDEKAPNLDVLTSFEIQASLMDGTGLLVEYVGSSLPGPVAAPVISIVAILEMVVRALLSGTQAFVAPALVFGLYSAYRSLVVIVARRRQGALPV